MDDLMTDAQIRPLLTRLRDYHEETYQHSLRVCLLSLDLGIQLHLSPSDLWYLGRASLLHDIGKLDIPSDILNKPSALTAHELKIMRQHVRLGFWVIQSMEHDLPDYEVVKKIAVAHHEFSTTPYPRSHTARMRKSAPAERRNIDQTIHYLSQIVAIADMTDALHSARAYKRGFSRTEIELILRREFQGDSILVDYAMWRLAEDVHLNVAPH
jgi:putative nucleotidyltransferase with HDIG domain